MRSLPRSTFAALSESHALSRKLPCARPALNSFVPAEYIHAAIEKLLPQFPNLFRGQAMEFTGTKRKLAAILMADVMRYGRLMEEDGPGTVVDFEAAGIANSLNFGRFGVRGGLEVPGCPCPTRGGGCR